jgi:hypothetical protein
MRKYVMGSAAWEECVSVFGYGKAPENAIAGFLVRFGAF